MLLYRWCAYYYCNVLYASGRASASITICHRRCGVMISLMRANQRVIGKPIYNGNIIIIIYLIQIYFLVFRMVAYSVRWPIQIESRLPSHDVIVLYIIIIIITIAVEPEFSRWKTEENIISNVALHSWCVRTGDLWILVFSVYLGSRTNQRRHTSLTDCTRHVLVYYIRTMFKIRSKLCWCLWKQFEIFSKIGRIDF